MFNSVRVGWLVAALAALVAVGCGDSSGTPSGDTGGGGGGDGGGGGGPLRACTSPGQPCAAHTACAINPVCGDDLLCRPQGYQNCDDGLDCTVDTCLGQGKCENKPKDGTCALSIKQGGETVFKCFNKGDISPSRTCQVCDPARSGTSWSPANGGSCDDGNSCTKDDYCDNGLCKGTDYSAQCADKFGCTDDVCDGKGGCIGNQLRSDYCLISGVCVKDKEQDSTGCNVCDVSKSQSKWTPLGSFCTIGGKCHKPGDRSPDGCGECDPVKNDKDWSPLPNLCKIGTQCFKPGDKNTSQGGCGVCDPTKNATGWTIPGSDCLIANVCRKPKDKSPSGCGECDPTKDKTDWTPLPNLCEIDGKCYNPGDKNTSEGGCGTCDPTKNAKAWTIATGNCYIAKQCRNPGDKDPVGCSTCDPTKSQTVWTPTPGCWAIVISALNKPRTGALGGTAKADADCQTQATAAGLPGKWKAYLADSTRTLKSLITGTNATTRKVVTTKGVQMYANWNSIFTCTSSTCTWASSADVFTFAGREIEESEPKPGCSGFGAGCFNDADFWHGANKDGTSHTDNCKNWTSSASTDRGSNGEADFWQMFLTERGTCNLEFAVFCVQVGP